MGEEEEQVEEIVVKITLPTEKTVLDAIFKLFPGIKVEVVKPQTEEQGEEQSREEG